MMATMTWNSVGNVKYYLNNAATGTADAYPGTPSDWTLSNTNTNVGQGASMYFYKGALSHFALFNSELSLASIQDLYDTDFP